MSKYAQNEVLAFSYDVWISGKKLTLARKQCITNIQIKETVDGADTCVIDISDPEMVYIEDNIYIEDRKIKVSMGWDGVTYRVEFEGYISAIDIDFPSDGIPKITMTCMDKTHLMNRSKKNKTYKKTTSAKVVAQIVKKYGYKCVVEKGYKYETLETITQSDQTDIDFILKLAKDEVYPFTARLVGKTFYYIKKGKLGTSVIDLTYMGFPHEIVSFKPQINKESIKKEIKKATVKKNKKVDKNTQKDSKTTDSNKSGTGGGSNTNSNKNSYTYDPSKKSWTKK